jgi:hypothetical protein
MPSISVPVERQVRLGREVEEDLMPRALAVDLIESRTAVPWICWRPLCRYFVAEQVAAVA